MTYTRKPRQRTVRTAQRLEAERRAALIAERAKLKDGVELRGQLLGTLERRLQPVGVVPESEMRDATVAPTGGPTTQEIAGTFIVYAQPYQVNDQYGTFTETMSPTVGTILTSSPDVRLLIDHDPSRLLARTKSGTLKLANTPNGLQMRASLDTRDSDAQNALVRIERGDLSQQSCCFRVARDEWSEDWSQRTIHALESLSDCSIVTYPASETTDVALAKKKPWDDDFAGPDGTQNAPMPAGGYMGGDGTGTRAAPVKKRNDALLLERDLLRFHRQGDQLRSAHKYSQKQIDALGAKGQAFKNPDGSYSYPIADHEDVAKAVKAVGRGAADHSAIRRFIMKRAKAIGASHLIPENWNADGSLKQSNT